MRHCSSGLVLALFLSFNSGGAKASGAGENNILITGSSTLAPLVSELAQAFERKKPQWRFDVQTGGSSKGIADCRSGLADLGMVSRPLKADDGEIKAIPIARDGLAFVTNTSVSVPSLSSSQIVAIFKGEIKNWREVGGADQAIVVVNKAEGRAALELFLQHFQIKSSEIKAAVIVGDEEQGLKSIAASRGAIGYVAISSIEAAQSAKVKAIALDGVPASLDEVMRGRYTVTRPLNLIVCGKSKPASEEFTRFVVSSEGQKLVKNLRYIPL